MDRRTALRAALATGGTALAGCLGRLGADGRNRPEECPVTQGLGVEWPADLDRSAAAAFVRRYEDVYYREVVVEYEPSTRLDLYELGVSVTGDVTTAGDGYAVTVSGGGGVYRPNLVVTAHAADPADDVDRPPADRFDGAVAAALEEAAGDPGTEVQRRVTDRDAVERHVETLDELLERRGLSGRGDSVRLFVDVDGSTVELTVRADRMHGDYMWNARYYVDEHVVRRTTEDGVDPVEGDLLECRTDP